MSNLFVLFSNHLSCPGVISMQYGLLAILFSPFPPLRSLLRLSQMLHRPQGNQGGQKLSINGTYKSLALKLDFFFVNVTKKNKYETSIYICQRGLGPATFFLLIIPHKIGTSGLLAAAGKKAKLSKNQKQPSAFHIIEKHSVNMRI